MNYFIDGNQVVAVEEDFINLAENEAGFGDSLEEAFLDLARKPFHKPKQRDLKSWEMPWYDKIEQALATPQEVSSET